MLPQRHHPHGHTLQDEDRTCGNWMDKSQRNIWSKTMVKRKPLTGQHPPHPSSHGALTSRLNISDVVPELRGSSAHRENIKDPCALDDR